MCSTVLWHVICFDLGEQKKVVLGSKKVLHFPKLKENEWVDSQKKTH